MGNNGNISASYDVDIARELGLPASALLNKLNYLSRYTKRKDGFCWRTAEELERELGISRKQQELAIKKLEEAGYIETKNTYIEDTHIKCKHFRVLIEKSDIEEREISDFDKRYKSEIDKKGKSINNNNTLIEKHNNNINNIYNPETTKKIIDYLNKKLDSNYRYNNKKTIELIKARINQGFTEEDFYKVIDKKINEWNDTEMATYLRPSTLFGTKFEDYLNQKEVKKKFDIRKVDWDKL